ncbi:MAG: hypothetical protein VB949_14990 [Pseudomonadales bacterium]|jgi:hypothetical protein
MHRRDVARTIADYTYRILNWGQNHVPRGIRSLIGLLFMVGGVFGFLPILGFWMLPLGAAFVALDIPPARRHIDAWMLKLYRRAYLEDPTSNQ